jgi:hypothetical protein
MTIVYLIAHTQCNNTFKDNIFNFSMVWPMA